MKSRWIALVALAVVTAAAHARWMAPEQIPTARVIANLDAVLKKNPRDHNARLTLARVYSLAYASHAATTPMYKDNQIPQRQTVQNGADHVPTDQEYLYLRKSLVNYNEVTRQNPDLGLAWLGSGFMLEEASRWASKMNPITFRGSKLSRKEDYENAALDAYRRCFEIGLETDFADNRAMHGIESQWLCREAGQSIIRLITQQHVGGFEPGERAKIGDAIQRSNDRPTAITPILIPLDRPRPLSELVDTAARVKFDLAGDKGGREWPWLNSRAAWLVWDPENSGKITSGRQLFGNATWWMMFSDGYAALASLDDNRDGWLQGRELKGIALWNDRNGNGKSDGGEVVSAQKWGIAAIKTSFDEKSSSALTAPEGIILRTGAKLPSYDWIPVSR